MEHGKFASPPPTFGSKLFRIVGRPIVQFIYVKFNFLVFIISVNLLIELVSNPVLCVTLCVIVFVCLFVCQSELFPAPKLTQSLSFASSSRPVSVKTVNYVHISTFQLLMLNPKSRRQFHSM